MGRFGLVALLFAMAGLVFGGLPATAGADEKERIKRAVERELEQRGYSVKRILPCRKRGPSRYRCEWRVEGRYANGSRYSCNGWATYLKRGRGGSLRVDRCLNADLWNLLLDRGLEPKAILNGSLKHGVWSFEWRAQGLFDGGVPYRCKDVARYVRKTRSWTVGRCDSEVAPAEPLSPEPGPPPVFGFNDDWASAGGSYFGLIPRATAVGGQVLRFTVSWKLVEASQGRKDWRGYDEVFAAMRANGVMPLPVVIGAPCWAQENPRECSPVGAPRSEEIPGFAQFAADVARRYPESFAVEIWNEPNWAHYFAPKPDPRRYSRMVRAAADAVHATGSGVPVVTGGMVPLRNSTQDGTKVAFDEFLRDVYAEGGIGSADAVGYHVYFGDVSDHDLSMRQQIARLRGTMSANGDGGLPVWITEMGIESIGSYTPQSQADILVSLHNTIRRMANIPVVIIHRFLEAPDDRDPSVIDRRGMIDVNGQVKPVYCALGAVRNSVPKECG